MLRNCGTPLHISGGIVAMDTRIQGCNDKDTRFSSRFKGLILDIFQIKQKLNQCIGRAYEIVTICTNVTKIDFQMATPIFLKGFVHLACIQAYDCPIK